MWPSAMSIGPAPVMPATPLPIKVSVPLLPLLVTTTQQAAVCCVPTEALSVVSNPLLLSAYDESALPFGAPPNASETTRCRRSLKPKGVVPAEAVTTGSPASPPSTG